LFEVVVQISSFLRTQPSCNDDDDNDGGGSSDDDDDNDGGGTDSDDMKMMMITFDEGRVHELSVDLDPTAQERAIKRPVVVPEKSSYLIRHLSI